MTKPQSYPFLAIARKYGLDYGDVLTIADMWRHPAERSDRERAADKRLAITLWLRHTSERTIFKIEMEIRNANIQFAAIQAGKIDWNTGEPARHDNGMLKSIPMTVELLKPLVTPLLDAATLKPVDDVDE